MEYGFTTEGSLNELARSYRQRQAVAEFEREQEIERWVRGEGPRPESNPAVITERGPLTEGRQRELAAVVRSERIGHIKAQNVVRAAASSIGVGRVEVPSRGADHRHTDIRGAAHRAYENQGEGETRSRKCGRSSCKSISYTYDSSEPSRFCTDHS